MKKQVFVLVMAIIMTFVALVNAGTYGGGDGSAANPYIIATPEQLNAIGSNPSDWNKHFELTDNIDMSNECSTVGWHIIGNNTTAFSGSFDGKKHTISNLSYSGMTFVNTVGLFGNTREATISNLTLSNVQIVPNGSYAGALVGYQTRGTITNCHSSGSILWSIDAGAYNKNMIFGGLVGQQYEGSIINCHSDCSVFVNNMFYDSQTYDVFVGGLVGQSNGSITACYSTGSVSASVITTFAPEYSFAGGLVGSSSGNITNCYSRGSVNCTLQVNSTTGGICTGGLTNRFWGNITNCYSTGHVTSNSLVDTGGLLGHSSGTGTVSGCFWDTQTSGQLTSAGGIGYVRGLTTAQMQFDTEFIAAGWDFSGTDGDMVDWYVPQNWYPQLSWQLGTIIVPDLWDVSQAEATGTIGAYYLTLGNITVDFSDNVEVGYVISQNPAAGTEVYAGAAVDLVISKGPAITVPDLVNIQIDSAQNTIISERLTIGNITEACSEEYAPGQVISQEPAAGEIVTVDTPVDLVVSTGIATVPYVIDQTLDSARVTLAFAGLTADTITYQCSDATAGTVLSQDPQADTRICNGSSVSLIVATGVTYLPDFADESYTREDALSYLADNGFTLGTVTMAFSDDVPSGYVISQTPAGYDLVCTGSSVDLVVSQGRQVIVPDYAGYYIWDAEDEFYNDNGLTLAGRFSVYDRSVEEGIVTGQFPAAGEAVAEGTPVALYYAGGSGWSDDPYCIWTAEQMNSIAQNQDDWGGYFKLMADIDMAAYSGQAYNIIGSDEQPFAGTFDGNGHTISNFSYTAAGQLAVGLFSTIGDATIKDLNLTNVNIEGTCLYAGAIAGRMSAGRIVNCSVSGEIVVGNYDVCMAGGLLGYDDWGTNIFHCSSSCTVNVNSQSTAYAGGIIGQQNDGMLAASFSQGGNITAYGLDKAYAGGLIGSQEWGGEIAVSYSNTPVMASATNSLAYAGGLTGYQNNGTITDSFSRNTVSADSIGSDVFAGGLVGLQDWGSISKCYATGNIQGSGFKIAAGGLVGKGGNITDCFWDVQASGVAESFGDDGSHGLATADMMKQATFTDAGWDFSDETANGVADHWRMCQDDINYPGFNWQGNAGDFTCQPGINIPELAAFAGSWSAELYDASYSFACDSDHDGKIDIKDFAVLAENWLK